MKLLLKITIGILVIGLSGYLFSDFLLELWWFSSLGFGRFFLLREGYEDFVKIGTTIAFSTLIYANFAYIPRALAIQSDVANLGLAGKLKKYKKLLGLLSFLIAIPVLIPVYENWESFLLFYFGAESELVDPVYGKHISYYLFSYPVYELVQDQLLVVFSVLLILVSGCYFLSVRKSAGEQQGLPVAAKLHIAKLIGVLVAIQAWSIGLERIEILYEDRHLPVFFGPGFVEMNYYLPLIWLSFLLFLGLAVASLYFLYTGKNIKLAIGLAIAYFSIVGVKQLDFIPDMIDEYYVKPNPVNAEASYIKNTIEATSDAFNLTEITEKQYFLESSLTNSMRHEINRELANIPIWDDDLLLSAFEELQSIRPYYNFPALSVDRYLLDDELSQVNIAVRELDYSSLADGAKNWRNHHLVYTHGYGVVISPAHQQANQPMQWLSHNFGLPAKFDELKLEVPEVYYGLADSPYAIVPNTESLKSEGNTDGDMNSDYDGVGGLPLSSLFTKAVASAFFQDERIFFSAGINDKSRILVRRNIFKRIKAIAPFLVLDRQPYPVVVNKKIYWIMDAFTASDRYPLVESVSLNGSDEQGKFNYARNSVKVIIDAYNGLIDFYIVDKTDPLIQTYQRLYPSLFKDIAIVPKPFIKHFSYPKKWLSLQMELYARFHQKEPEVFYQQSEALEFARMADEVVEPYYLTIDIDEFEGAPNREQRKFILVSPLSPLGRENLDSIAIAGCLKGTHCHEDYQEDIFIYKFPNDIQVEGPGQISALINQNPDIAKQFFLWDQQGSKIIRGRMIIVPIEHTLLYIQPLYLESTSANGFPSLAKVIVAVNRETVMADSLPLAFEAVVKKLSQK